MSYRLTVVGQQERHYSAFRNGFSYKNVRSSENRRRGRAVLVCCRPFTATTLALEIESLLVAQDQAGSFIEGFPNEEATVDLEDLPIEPMMGQQIGPYKVINLIGRGGMGEVFLAQDSRLGRRVALKLLPVQFTALGERVRRFEQEARSASSLNHPNIITVHDIGEIEGRHYLVTEYVEGETLRHRMESAPQQRIKLSEALEVAMQVVTALAAAHEAGIVHRDIKPDNIMLRPDGLVKVLDFGLAKLTEPSAPAIGSEAPTSGRASTEGGLVMGTPRYMSPEQARGLRVDARTDIFSLAIVLYEMVAGSTPFAGATAADVIAAILGKEPVALAHHLPGVPSELERIVSKALRKEPGDRYQVIKELLVDLKDLKRELERAAETGRGDRPDEGKDWWAAWSRSRVKGAVALGAMVVLAAVWYWQLGSGAGIKEALETKDHVQLSTPSIAVLPFVNMSKEEDQDFFAVGLSEELINELSKNPRLRVVARTSAFAFKGKNEDLRAIGQKLNATTVLEGSVRKEADQLRITAQLINTADGFHLWSQTYERRLTDIFSIQEDVAASVAEALNITLLGSPPETRRPQTTNPEAYNAFLRGNYFQERDDWMKAIGYYTQALQVDPNYARAWAALSITHALQANYSLVPVEDAYQKARQEADQAMKFDPNIGESNRAVGLIKQFYDWDWSGADAAYKRALEVEPGNAANFGYAAGMADTLGRYDEAVRLMRRRVELDPLSVQAHIYHGLISYDAGLLTEAESAIKKALDLDPGNVRALRNLGYVYLAQSNPHAALVELQRISDPGWRNYGLALAHHAAGNKRESDAALARYIAKYGLGAAYQIAEIYAYRGEPDSAFQWLERAYREHDAGLTAAKSDPLLRNLARDPRYSAFLQKMGLPVD